MKYGLWKITAAECIIKCLWTAYSFAGGAMSGVNTRFYSHHELLRDPSHHAFSHHPHHHHHHHHQQQQHHNRLGGSAIGLSAAGHLSHYHNQHLRGVSAVGFGSVSSSGGGGDGGAGGGDQSQLRYHREVTYNPATGSKSRRVPPSLQAAAALHYRMIDDAGAGGGCGSDLLMDLTSERRRRYSIGGSGTAKDTNDRDTGTGMHSVLQWPQ